MDRSNGICERCNSQDADHVHHLTYARKYNEALEDLQAVCERCHDGIHRPPKKYIAVERCETGYRSMAPFEIETLELMIMAPQVVFLVAERLGESMQSTEAKRLFSALVDGELPNDDVANECKRWAKEKFGFNRASVEDRLASLTKRVNDKKDERRRRELLSRLDKAEKNSEESWEIFEQLIKDARQRQHLVD